MPGKVKMKLKHWINKTFYIASSKYKGCKLDLGALPDILIGRPTSLVAFCHWGNIYVPRLIHKDNIYVSSEAIIGGYWYFIKARWRKVKKKRGYNAFPEPRLNLKSQNETQLFEYQIRHKGKVRVKVRSCDGQVVRWWSGEGWVKVRWSLGGQVKVSWATIKFLFLCSEFYVNAP